MTAVEIAKGRPHAALLTVALGVIRLYRWSISPLLATIAGPACRFDPTCSEYAHQALAAHGFGCGLYLTLRRLVRCRPGGGWGYDPVPAHDLPARNPQHP